MSHTLPLDDSAELLVVWNSMFVYCGVSNVQLSCSVMLSSDLSSIVSVCHLSEYLILVKSFYGTEL